MPSRNAETRTYGLVKARPGSDLLRVKSSCKSSHGVSCSVEGRHGDVVKQREPTREHDASGANSPRD